MAEDRKKVWVDRFQTRLFHRIGAYLTIYFVCLINLLFIWRLIAEGPGNPIEQYIRVLQDNAPALVILLILLPFLAYDAIRFSHRLVGPLCRFRKTMEDIANGEPVRLVKLRDGDFLDEFRDDFNKMLEVLQKSGIPAIKPAGAEDDDQRQIA